MVLVSCSSVWSFPRNRRPRFTHDNDEKRLLLRQSKQIDNKKRADNDRQHWQTKKDNQQSIAIRVQFGSWVTRIYKCYHRSCSTRGDIPAESFACQRYTTNQTDGSSLNSGSIVNVGPRLEFWAQELSNDVFNCIVRRLENRRPDMANQTDGMSSIVRSSTCSTEPCRIDQCIPDKQGKEWSM